MPKGGREQMDSRLAQVLWGEVPPPSFLCPHRILVGGGVTPPIKTTGFPRVLGHDAPDPYQLLWFSMGGYPPPYSMNKHHVPRPQRRTPCDHEHKAFVPQTTTTGYQRTKRGEPQRNADKNPKATRLPALFFFSRTASELRRLVWHRRQGKIPCLAVAILSGRRHRPQTP